MIYESLLLTAVEALAVFLYLLATRNQHTPLIDQGLKFFLFLVAAAYFVHFWVDSGHTLAMKTWRIKLVMPGHARVPYGTAALRYLLAWGWFLPAFIAIHFLHLSRWPGIGAFVAGIMLWGLSALFDKDRQFLHDKLLGTRLILLPKREKTNTSVQAKA
jgi:uncharacterized RDD family membrane protein YckC